MSEPGDATTVGAIIAYLRMNRDQWNRDVDATRRDAEQLGATSPDIRIQTNAGETIAQLGAVRAAERGVGQDANNAKPFVLGLIGALAAIAPAAVPIAAVAGGALLGLLPTAAAVVLGISGIRDEMKSGALQGTQYGQDIATVQSWLGQLKQTAASGLLDGVDQAVQHSRPLFAELKQDIGTTSSQFGTLAADAIPALLAILHQLEPLFTTIGADLDKGAAGLEHWATSSTEVSKFVAYVQAELPTVEQLIGNLIVLFSHLAQGAAPFGGILLSDISLFVHVLDAIPVGVLQQAIPLVIALYVAVKSYQGVNAIVAGVNGAIRSMKAPFAESAAAAQASSLATQAAAAEEAAGVARSRADEAAAAAAASAEIAASLEGTGSILEATAAQASAAAAEFSTAMQVEADEAQASAARIAASAEAAAAATRTEAETTEAASAGMLGPIGAVVGGLAIFSTMLIGNSHDAQNAAQAMDSYSESVKKSTDALAAANIAQTNDNLAKQGALRFLDQLHQQNQATSLSYTSLTQAVNGTNAQYEALRQTLSHIVDTTPFYSQQHQQAQALLEVVGNLRDGLQQQIQTQKDLNATNQQSQSIVAAQTTELQKQAAQYGVSVSAYQAAKQAAAQNTQQTQAQTLAFQLENNAAGLVNQALQSLSGQNLNNAQAQTALDQATLSLTQSLRTNGSTVADNTAKGIANQQAIEGAAAALRTKMQAEASATGSTEQATEQYKTNAAALLTEIGRIDGTTSAAYKYAQQLLKIPPVVKTQVDMDTSMAISALDALQNKIESMGGSISINNLKYLTSATGGPVQGVGPKGVDSQPYLLAPGEWVINDRSVDKYGPGFMAALNAGTLALPTVATSSSGGALAGASPALPAYGELVLEVRALRGQVAAVEYAVRDSARENAATIGDRFDRTINTSDRRNHILVATGAGKGTGLS